MGRTGSGPEFHVNSGSGRVGALHLWVVLGRVNKIGPMSVSAPSFSDSVFLAWPYVAADSRT